MHQTNVSLGELGNNHFNALGPISGSLYSPHHQPADGGAFTNQQPAPNLRSHQDTHTQAFTNSITDSNSIPNSITDFNSVPIPTPANPRIYRSCPHTNRFG